MKALSGTVPLAVLAAGVAAAVALLGLCRLEPGTHTVRAQTPVLVALDMDPTGNFCPGDGVNDCTLGPIDSCVSVAAGASFQFDVVLDDLPLAPLGFGLVAIDFQLLWGAQVTPPEPDVIDITARLPVSTLIHYLQQAPGSSSTLNDAQALPRLLPPYVGSINDLGTEETNPPWTQGTGWRGALTVAAGAANGFYKLEFDAPYMWVGNSVPYNECETETPPGPGCTLQNAVVAVGLSCPAPTPVPAGGVAELPDVASDSGWSTGAYAGLAGGLAAAVLALTAGAWYARRRRAR